MLETELPWLKSVTRAKRSQHLPVVLSSAEVHAILSELSGEYRLIGNVLYGGGLRLLEGLRLRIKDLQFEYRQIVVRSGKGNKDRVTIMPEALVDKHASCHTFRHCFATHLRWGTRIARAGPVRAPLGPLPLRSIPRISAVPRNRNVQHRVAMLSNLGSLGSWS